MRRLFGLLLKELWQHALVLVLVGGFIAFVQAILLLGAAVGPRTITMLEAHATFTRVFLPLLGLALGHRLVVREYSAHTQRFLEALPLYRWEVLLTKFTLGFTVMAAAVTVSLGCASLIALVKEPLTFHWLALIFMRSQVFALTLFSVFFLMGLLGRWRVPIYMASGLLLLFLDQGTELDVSRFGPFGLAGARLVLERHAAPWLELGVSLAVSFGAIALSAALTLLDEGSAAESLAKRMSQRERIAVGVVLCLALIAWEIADPQHDKEPFGFEHAAVVRRDDVDLEVLYLDERYRADAEAIADRLAADLRTLRRELGYGASTGPVHVALRPTLAPHDYEDVGLERPEDGTLVRAPIGDPAFDAPRLSAFVLERVIEHATDERAAFEPHAWVRAGTAGLIAFEEEAPDLRPATFYRRHRRLSYGALDRLWRTSERFGPDVARALATSAALAFEEEHGRAAWMAFAREVLDADPSPGLFAVARERGDSVRDRFGRVAVSIEAFEERWRVSLSRASGSENEAVPLAHGWVRVEREEGPVRSLRWGLRFDSPPPSGALCALLHTSLGPFDDVLADAALSREEVPCAELDASGRRLVGRYAARDRVFFAVEMQSADARLRLHAERRELD